MGYVSSGGGGGSSSANSTSYDNSTSGVTSTTVQSAIDLLSEGTTAMRFWRPDYTFGDSAVDVNADTVTLTNHHIGTGTVCVFDTTWGGFTQGVQYNAIRIDGNTLKFADSRLNATAGIARNITGLPGGNVLLTSTNGQNVSVGSVHRTKTQLTYSIGDADVDPATDTITIPNHPFTTGHGIQFATTWGGVSSGTLYYAIKVDDNNFKVASSDYLARVGTPVDITADPGGTVSLYGCYGNMLCDAFVSPAGNAEYVVSVGYGGAHAVLFGFGGGGARLALTGNLSTSTGGAVDVSVTSGNDEVFAGKPVLISLLIYGGYAVVLLNGVPSKRFTKATGRGVDQLGSDSVMYIGGSDHSNYEGDIYWVRLFENGVPAYYDPNVAYCLRTSPRPSVTYYETVTSSYITACGLWDFTSPASCTPNLGVPLYGDRTNNAIRGAGTHSDTFGAFNGFAEYELPQLVPVAPLARPDYGLTPTAAPVGAKIFDSFKRNDVTYTFSNYLGLGWTEGGSLGVKQWLQTHPSAPRHGILFGRAFVEGTGTNTTREYVNNDSPYMKVTIKNNGNETEGAGLFAAYDFDADTGIMAIHNAGDTITLYKVTTGTPASLGSYVIPGTNVPYTLGIEYTSTRQVRLLIDGTAQVDYDDSGSAALTGVSAGFTASVGYCRFEDFAVYAASA